MRFAPSLLGKVQNEKVNETDAGAVAIIKKLKRHI